VLLAVVARDAGDLVRLTLDRNATAAAADSRLRLGRQRLSLRSSGGGGDNDDNEAAAPGYTSEVLLRHPSFTPANGYAAAAALFALPPAGPAWGTSLAHPEWARPPPVTAATLRRRQLRARADTHVRARVLSRQT
jgi:hypothetical protein